MRTSTAKMVWIGAVLTAASLQGCSSAPAGEVSSKELASVRQSYTQLKAGQPRQAVLDTFKAGNKVKLGSSVAGGVTIEEWKVEAFHDESNRKDLFVTFLYFCDDRFVDSSDARIDFRNNPKLVEEWKSLAAR